MKGKRNSAAAFYCSCMSAFALYVCGSKRVEAAKDSHVSLPTLSFITHFYLECSLSLSSCRNNKAKFLPAKVHKKKRKFFSNL